MKIELSSDVKTWFTSDNHFGHKNIIHHCDRPVSDVIEMESWLINKLKSKIQPEDIVIHTGDFLFSKDKLYEAEFKRIVELLPGSWMFVPGNHDDKYIDIMTRALEGTRHKVLEHYVEAKYNKRLLIICHYPFRNWKNSRVGSINIHGHEHGSNTNIVKNQIDVGIDAIPGNVPILLDDLILQVDNMDGELISHHEGQKTGKD